jgi:hypothetical protein
MENYKALEEMKDFENLQINYGYTKKATTSAKLPTLGATMADHN